MANTLVTIKYLTKCGIYPETQPEDQILKAAKPDFIALNYYRTLVASYLPTDEQHPLGTKRTLILIYTVILKSKKSTFKTSKYGAQIDPTGLRLVLNDYYRQYRLPLIITKKTA